MAAAVAAAVTTHHGVGDYINDHQPEGECFKGNESVSFSRFLACDVMNFRTVRVDIFITQYSDSHCT